MSMVVTALVAAVALDTAEQSAAGVHVNPPAIPAVDGLLHEMCCACTAVEPPVKTAPKPQIEIASTSTLLIRRSGAKLCGPARPPNLTDVGDKIFGG
jgi:hypothetical protein